MCVGQWVLIAFLMIIINQSIELSKHQRQAIFNRLSLFFFLRINHKKVSDNLCHHTPKKKYKKKSKIRNGKILQSVFYRIKMRAAVACYHNIHVSSHTRVVIIIPLKSVLVRFEAVIIEFCVHY